MNARVLGSLCIAGGVIGLADGVRLVILGRQLTPGFQQLDNATEVATLLAALGGLSGLLGLMALRATGDNPVFRLLGYLPGISYVASVVLALGNLAGVLTGDPDNPVTVLLAVLSDLFYPAAWLAVAILTLAAKRLHGWRRFVPFVLVVAFPLGIVATGVTGLAGTFRIIAYAAVVLFGYAVQRNQQAAQLRKALA